MTSTEYLRRRALILSSPVAFLVFRELKYFRTKLCFMAEKLKVDDDEVTQEGDVLVVYRSLIALARCVPIDVK